ncbi:MAG: tripartite tricarboxylate transporter substrate binding protein [Burkholderiales bacterium]|nr:tripartite tricarboxylate transporter substrate binding protein [Burkholderiales bacterium]
MIAHPCRTGSILAQTLWALLLPVALAQAQPYPSRPVRLVIQFGPGSSGDTMVRIVSSPLAETLGQPVIVDNRAGAGGMVAAELVRSAPPDGYTLLGGSSSTQVIRRFMARSMPFDPEKEFTPISQWIQSVATIVASPALPAATLKDLIAFARANPGKIAYGTSGVGSEHHLSGEQIKQITGIDMLHVPYKVGMQGLLDVAAGRLPIAFAIYAVALPQAKAGKVRILAVVREQRTPRLPDVPAVPEAVPGFEPPPSWVGLFAPASLPAALLRRISEANIKALSLPETRARLDQQGLDVIGSTPQEFAALIRRQSDLVGRIVKAADIQPLE